MSLQFDTEHFDFPLYEELEVSPRASDAVIRAAYGRLVRLHSEDRARVRRLKTAFDVLSNDQTRRAYDTLGVETGQSRPRDRASGQAAGGGRQGLSDASTRALILALSLFAGALGGFEVLRLVAVADSLPFR